MVKQSKLAETITSQDCAVILRAVGDSTRLRILESLLTEEKCVGDLVVELKRPQPQISQHLRVLRQIGLIEGMREGKQICYRIVPHLRPVLKKRNEQTLNFGCCQLSFPVTLSES
ncbi:MAG: metalloregulator ArsR/SmtB family transcription factor [Nitrospirales bacterium]|nr:metalloregulator ArsR/SmtB family transcription factor [Nitrospirales bacterium]